MFDGMPDQFYQFLAAASRANNHNTSAASADSLSLPLPLPFSLHHHHHHHGSYPPPPPPPPPPPLQATFDHQGLLSPPPHLFQHHHNHHPQLSLHQLQQPPPSSHIKNEVDNSNKEAATTTSLSTTLDPNSPGLEPLEPWSNDEVLALLRIRSAMDSTWFPDFTWENVSRKLAELGFKRSAEKCKEKFEEETRSFNSSFITPNNNINNNKSSVINNYRLFGELEELYNNDHSDHHHHQQQQSSLSPPLDHQPHPVDDQDEPRRNQTPEKGQIIHPDEDREDEEGDKTWQDEDEDEDEDEEDDTRNDKERCEQSLDDSEKTEENTKKVMMMSRRRRRKRKRREHKKFEMFKEFCENIVNKMMAQQEQLHYKILQDMVKRDEEKTAMEEAWKKQEIERIHKEMEIRAHEVAIAGDRQAKILDFLNKFVTSNSSLDVHSIGEAIENLIKVPKTSPNHSSILNHQDTLSTNPTSCSTSITQDHQNPSCLVTQHCLNMPTSSQNENLAPHSPNRVENSKLALPISSSSFIDHQASQNPNSLNRSTQKSSGPSNHTSTDAADHSIMNMRSLENQTNVKADDTGRRWPRDEVLALINIRCSLFNNNNNMENHDNHPPHPLTPHHHDKDQCLGKGPLWERISQKMMEMGYTRSAKRCKEKWENINKYFRKTKDLNKKRSVDSRTCPYFHQLRHLYTQGTLVETVDRPSTNLPSSPENRSTTTPILLSDVQGGGSASNDATTTTMHVSQGISQGVVQVPSFEFEF